MKKRVSKLIMVIGGFLLLAIGILFLFDGLDYGVPCIFHEVTNLYCPGCGMTRAFISLFHGNIFESIRNNALIVFLPFVLIYLIIAMIRYIKEGNNTFLKISDWVIYILLFIVIAFGVIRNIPGFEFLLPIK